MLDVGHIIIIIIMTHQDRQPYATTVLDGKTLSARPQYSKLHHNWIVANYAADGGCYDNDDGSSWYLEQDNFCIYGGMKSNFEGKDGIRVQ